MMQTFAALAAGWLAAQVPGPPPFLQRDFPPPVAESYGGGFNDNYGAWRVAAINSGNGCLIFPRHPHPHLQEHGDCFAGLRCRLHSLTCGILYNRCTTSCFQTGGGCADGATPPPPVAAGAAPVHAAPPVAQPVLGIDAYWKTQPRIVNQPTIVTQPPAAALPPIGPQSPMGFEPPLGVQTPLGTQVPMEIQLPMEAQPPMEVLPMVPPVPEPNALPMPGPPMPQPNFSALPGPALPQPHLNTPPLLRTE